MRPLSSWLTDFIMRLMQLEEWQNNPADIPKVNVLLRCIYLLLLFLPAHLFTHLYVCWCGTKGDMAIWLVQSPVLLDRYLSSDCPEKSMGVG
jgi:hypothetical protein